MPMPLTEETRAEFGYNRTECACRDCAINCRFVPGYLIPSDIERIGHQLGYTNLVRFAFENLAASLGATVMDSTSGRVFRIPTLVPQRKPDGTCKYLESDGCAIHAVSPYGCAMFDAHQSPEDANLRSARGLQEIAREWAGGGARNLYVCLWRMLDAAGLRAVPPEIARQWMQEAGSQTESMRREENAEEGNR